MKEQISKDLTGIIQKIKKREFNQFDIFEDIFKENCISKILAYLLDSDEAHLLEGNFTRLLLEQIKVKKIYPALKKIDFTKIETTAVFNKATDKKRFIDIVVECYVRHEESETPFFVLGIEVKKWDIERESQISDYQKFLSKEYNAPALMLYHTPNGKESLTVDRKSNCKYKTFDYYKIKRICDEVITTNSEVDHFIKKFGEYMSSSIAGKLGPKLRQEIKELWENNKNEMRLITNYGRNPKNPKNPKTFIYEKLIPALNQHESMQSAYVVWHYTRDVAVPKEYNLSINKIDCALDKKKPYQLYFMIKNEGENPLDNSSWTISVAAWPNDKKYNKTAESDEKKYKKMFEIDSIQTWSPWTILESSTPFTIDYEKSDPKKTIDTIIEYIDEARARIRKFYSLKNI